MYLRTGLAIALQLPGDRRDRQPLFLSRSGSVRALAPAALGVAVAAAHRSARPQSRAFRPTQERVCATLRSLDSARPEGHHGPAPARPAGYRSSRARPRSGGATLAGLPRRGTRRVLVAGLIGVRLHPMVPPQPRFPLRRPSGARWVIG